MKSSLRLLCAITLIASLGSTVALAAPDKLEGAEKQEKKPSKKVLQKYDANHDGVLDDAEKAAWQADVAKEKAAKRQKELEQLDTNKDGKIDKAERAAGKETKPAEPAAPAAHR